MYKVHKQAMKYHKKEDETQIELPLHVGREELLQKYNTFALSYEQQKLPKILEQFDLHCERNQNKTHVFYVFHNMKQTTDQTFEMFAQAVAKQADQCAFAKHATE